MARDLKLLSTDTQGNLLWADVSRGDSKHAMFYTAYMLHGEPVLSMDHNVYGFLQVKSTGCRCLQKTCACAGCDHCPQCEEFATHGKGMAERWDALKKGMSGAVANAKAAASHAASVAGAAVQAASQHHKDSKALGKAQSDLTKEMQDLDAVEKAGTLPQDKVEQAKQLLMQVQGLLTAKGDAGGE